MRKIVLLSLLDRFILLTSSFSSVRYDSKMLSADYLAQYPLVA